MCIKLCRRSVAGGIGREAWSGRRGVRPLAALLVVLYVVLAQLSAGSVVEGTSSGKDGEYENSRGHSTTLQGWYVLLLFDVDGSVRIGPLRSGTRFIRVPLPRKLLF
uniref:Uncharacterized protein n=1 Tax=Anopheles melas TaxID=34690 RepID=A0A182U8W8_9DIPT